MPEWIHQLHYLLTESTTVSLITVIATQGSAPRKPGSKMLVTSGDQLGTIGGGNLEFSAVKMARDRHLANLVQPHRQKFALGPALGQCCGGAVEVLFETVERSAFVTDADADWYCRRIDSPATESVRLATAGDYQKKLKNDLELVTANTCFTLLETTGEIWACDRLTSTNPVVFVFGAGHVGQALVAQLSLLDCDIVWVDERAGMLPAETSARVNSLVTDCPADEVSNAADDAWFIVMTHSHATDFDICMAILKKKRFSFLGLIGSQTKRNTFRKRLVHRDVDPELIDRLCCPIGIEGIQSDHPEAIALGVAAQLTMLWESEDQPHAESIID